jgi:hypothetical protein
MIQHFRGMTEWRQVKLKMLIHPLYPSYRGMPASRESETHGLLWIPAFAGMTVLFGLTYHHSGQD